MLKDKNVAIIFTASILGGHELMSVAHIKKFVKKGFSISCYLPSDNQKLIDLLNATGIDYELHHVHHKRMEIIHSFFNPLHLIKSSLLLKKISLSHDYMVIIQGDIELGAGFLNSGRLLGVGNRVVSYIPYAHSFETMGSRLAKVKDFLARFTYKSCSNYVTICNQFRHELKAKNKTADVRVLRNFVAKPVRKDIRGIGYEFVTDPARVKILMAGRVFFRQKGQDILLEALRGINTNVDLTVIGDGPDLDEMKNNANRLGSNIRVEFLGWKSNVWDFAYDVDFIVIPSSYEGVPLIMLEALKRKVPVIAPARDGMLDYLSKDSLYFIDDGESEVDKLREKIKLFIVERVD
ncbi:glycosyltransferase [Serratia sp. NPDC087055]|uniref:glycosyltransferase n=1 Tax=Serratia sp. NPDC087055 TaxID=3364516 RepID=UPI00384A718D